LTKHVREVSKLETKR